jgi:hypothetical protein
MSFIRDDEIDSVKALMNFPESADNITLQICRYTFYVPAVSQPFHWGFHSCNGLSASADLELWGEPLLWKDVLARHKQDHLHLMVGGGDQIYNDGFWKTKPFQNWLDINGNKASSYHLSPNEQRMGGHDKPIHTESN